VTTDRTPTALLPLFVTMIVGVGAARFVLTVVGVSDPLTRYASMTAVILAGVVWFGSMTLGWRERMRVAYSLILPYALVEIAGRGYTFYSGRYTIFHAPEYSMGTSLRQHLLGHAIGGLTWEPLGVFAVMSVLAWIFRLTRPS